MSSRHRLAIVRSWLWLLFLLLLVAGGFYLSARSPVPVQSAARLPGGNFAQDWAPSRVATDLTPWPTHTPRPCPAQPTLTPTPTGTPVAGALTLDIPAARANTGYADSMQPQAMFLGQQPMWTGMDTTPNTPRILHGVMQFDLSSLPPGARLLSAVVVLRGYDDEYLTACAGGLWNLRLLDPSVDNPWRHLTYWYIHNTPVLATIGATLIDPNLGDARVNEFGFDAHALAFLQARLLSTGRASFRLDGESHLPWGRHIFAWDGAAPPVLHVTYTQ